MDSPTPSADHDLLIEVNTNVKNLTTTIGSYTDANNRTSQDHENRLRVVESARQQLEGAQKSQKIQIAIIGTLGGVVSVVLGVISFIKP